MVKTVSMFDLSIIVDTKVANPKAYARGTNSFKLNKGVCVGTAFGEDGSVLVRVRTNTRCLRLQMLLSRTICFVGIVYDLTFIRGSGLLRVQSD